MNALERRIERLEGQGAAKGVGDLVIGVEGRPDFEERLAAGRVEGCHLIIVRHARGRRDRP